MNTEEYDEGWSCYNSGYEVEENPYQFGTDGYYEWEAGWYDAADYAGYTYGQRL